MADLALTACRRCREQKLRCSRQQPECARCSRLRVFCTYPKPPDRKLLASLRVAGKKQQQQQRKRSADSSQERSRADESRQPETSSGEISIMQKEERDLPEKVMPNQDVQRLLLDLYFTRAFNAPLTFHRPTFTEMLMKNEMPQSLLLAVCAAGTIFLTAETIGSIQATSSIPPIQELKDLATHWALQAGKIVLPRVDQSALIEIQTCAVLALYWFATGDSYRNTMFSGIAYRAIRALTLNAKSPASFSGSDRTSTQERLESDTMHRCFWTVWIPNCINSDHHISGSSADCLLMRIPLPGDTGLLDEVLLRGYTPSELSDDQTSADTEVGDTITAHVMAEMVRMVFYWAQVRDHIETRKLRSPQETHADLFILDQKLLTWAGRLSRSFSYSKRNLYEHLVVKQQPCYVVVHAMFHQCRLVLHSSIVPQFSGVPLQKNISPEVVRTSARIALESAQAISRLAADFLALEWDPSQIAPFVGYCMYVSASVHMTFISSKNAELANAARSNLVSSAKLLDTMRPFWITLDKLWKRFHILYQVQVQKNSSQSMNLSAGMQSSLNSIDELAHLKRDVGRLTEPLADSILQYSLRKLQRQTDDRDIHQSSRRLEDEIQADRETQLTQMIFQSSSSASQPLAADFHSFIQNTSPEANNALRIGILDPLDTNQYDSHGALSYQTTDWWSMDMDSDMFAMPILPFEDLLGENAIPFS